MLRYKHLCFGPLRFHRGWIEKFTKITKVHTLVWVHPTTPRVKVCSSEFIRTAQRVLEWKPAAALNEQCSVGRERPRCRMMLVAR